MYVEVRMCGGILIMFQTGVSRESYKIVKYVFVGRSIFFNIYFKYIELK